MANKGKFKLSESVVRNTIEWFVENPNEKLSKNEFCKKAGCSLSALDNALMAYGYTDYTTMCSQHLLNQKTRVPESRNKEKVCDQLCEGLVKWLNEHPDEMCFKLTDKNLNSKLEKYGCGSIGRLFRKYESDATRRRSMIVNWFKEYRADLIYIFDDYTLSRARTQLSHSLNDLDNLTVYNTERKTVDSSSYGDENDLLFFLGMTIGILHSQKKRLPEQLRLTCASQNGVDCINRAGKGVELKATLDSHYAINSNYEDAEYVLCWNHSLSDENVTQFKLKNGIKEIFTLFDLWDDFNLAGYFKISFNRFRDNVNS